MDIRCRFCGESWDHDELHYLVPPKQLLREFRELELQFTDRALDEVRRECGGQLRTDKDAERAFARARYYAAGALFRRYGCLAFGCGCSGADPDDRAGAVQDVLEYPEEWAE